MRARSFPCLTPCWTGLKRKRERWLLPCRRLATQQPLPIIARKNSDLGPGCRTYILADSSAAASKGTQRTEVEHHYGSESAHEKESWDVRDEIAESPSHQGERFLQYPQCLSHTRTSSAETRHGHRESTIEDLEDGELQTCEIETGNLRVPGSHPGISKQLLSARSSQLLAQAMGAGSKGNSLAGRQIPRKILIP
ncbi:hypothetical protein DFH09DRAFT_1426653 [Mycena vulgaris]|nr:hypothetical protein DFH09DRAFT_1426653 [Mycena vulgaris]